MITNFLVPIGFGRGFGINIGRVFSELDDLMFEPILLRPEFFPCSLTLFERDYDLPKVNVEDTEKAYLVDVEAPGFEKDEIDADLEGKVLTIKVEKETEKEEDEKNFYTREMTSQSLYRRILLPEEVVADSMSAKYDKGILKLTLPKVELSEPKEKNKE